MTLPSTGVAYVDANSLIHTVEQHSIYAPLMEPLWLAAQAKTIEVLSSDLALMECLVGPLKRADSVLVKNDESALLGTEMRLLPITQSILRDAAQLRATTKLRTPDAIHAATAQQSGCSLFVTNDVGFRAVPGLPVVIFDDLRTT
jgi:predicted nucleic acid-binding protein